MITGYRRYNLLPAALDIFVLRGVLAAWYERELHATCQASAERCEEHLANDVDCTCGIYVLRGPDYVDDYVEWPVIAAVSGWGPFVEYEAGWRIQHVRLEHLWIEPSWIEAQRIDNWDPQEWLDKFSQTYGVGVEIRRSAICCGKDHEMGYWPAKGGPILICKMETSHIVNCLKYVIKAARRDRAAAKWKYAFEKELESRKPRMVDGKVRVTF